jgi:hypothetical protein
MIKQLQRSREDVKLEQKLGVIRRIETSERQMDVGRHFEFSGSSVKKVLNSADKIKGVGQSAVLLTASELTHTRSFSYGNDGVNSSSTRCRPEPQKLPFEL